MSDSFSFLMEKELQLQQQFREYNLTRGRKLSVTYWVMDRRDLIFKLDVEIEEK